MAESLKVPKEQFEAVIRALLKSAPLPMKEIAPARKRKPTVKPKRG